MDYGRHVRRWRSRPERQVPTELLEIQEFRGSIESRRDCQTQFFSSRGTTGSDRGVSRPSATPHYRKVCDPSVLRLVLENRRWTIHHSGARIFRPVWSRHWNIARRSVYWNPYLDSVRKSPKGNPRMD